MADAAPSAWEQLNARMVERIRASGGIRSAAVAQAFLQTARHQFVPNVGLDAVYSGVALVIRSDSEHGAGSSSSEVAVMGPMLEALAITGGERVLEIGVGTGYNAALLDVLVGPTGAITSIENQPDLAECAREHLRRSGHPRVAVISSDGFAGHLAGAPYDRIIATASVSDIPVAWRDQLREGGILVVPLRLRPGASMIATFRRTHDELESLSIIPGSFMPLRSARQPLERSVVVAHELDAALAFARDTDAATIEQLLRGEVSLEPFRSVPWQGPFVLAGLIEHDWIVLRHARRSVSWSGVYDRDAPGLALLSALPLPLTAPPALLTFGPRATRDRLVALLDEIAGVAIEQLRVRAVPRGTPLPSTDAFVEAETFCYAISWRHTGPTGARALPRPIASG